MKKILITVAIIMLSASYTQAADIDLQQIDNQTRAAQPNSNSIMFRRNADEYNRLSDSEKAEIEQQREAARRKMEEYQKQKEAYERQKAIYEAQQRAAEEQERRRQEELKPITLAENKLKIYALVNGELITSRDMQSRINAFILTTGIPYNAKTKAMINDKVLQAAIDEKLKLQEAQKNKIKVTPHEIKEAVKGFEKMNNMASGQLERILSEAKVSMNTWKKQLEADIAWKKLISSKGSAKISVSENEIDRAITDFNKDMQTQKYMVLELVLNRKDAKDIQQLAETLRQDPRFELYAMQFSQSPSAANGGRLGWITKGKLPQVLENSLFKLKEGEVSDPILYGNDYYILKLEEIFNPATDKPKEPSRKEVRAFLENKKLEEMSVKYIKDLRSRALIEKKM